MFEAYILFIISCILTPANSVFFIKKYQLATGTSLKSNFFYLFVNGAISTIPSIIAMFFTSTALQFTTYSFVMALAIVISSAVNNVATLKAYESGQMAVANIYSTVGSIILSCLYGVVILNEKMSVFNVIAIVLMISSVILINESTESKKANYKLLLIYAVMILASSATSILSKQHQVETLYSCVDTLSFSFWIAIIRTIVFLPIIPLVLPKKEQHTKNIINKSSVFYSVIASLISGSCYIITLLTSKLINISIMSPLTTGLYIIVSTLLPFIAFREQLTKKQIIGAAVSFAGTMMFILG